MAKELKNSMLDQPSMKNWRRPFHPYERLDKKYVFDWYDAGILGCWAGILAILGSIIFVFNS